MGTIIGNYLMMEIVGKPNFFIFFWMTKFKLKWWNELWSKSKIIFLGVLDLDDPKTSWVAARGNKETRIHEIPVTHPHTEGLWWLVFQVGS